MSARQLATGPSATRAASKACSSVRPSARLIEGATSQASVSAVAPAFGTNTASSTICVPPNRKASDRPLPNGLATWDWDTGRSDRFLFGDSQIVEEAVFVPRGPNETDAWLIAPSINLAEGVTELHAFDAARVADGPVASWRADVALPAGFHGVWAG